MKKLNRISFFFLTLILLSIFISCEKDELETSVYDIQENIKNLDQLSDFSKNSGSSVVYSDKSGTIKVKVFFRSFNGSNNSGSVSVGSGYVLVGGGAWSSPNSLLTSSFPLRDGKSWKASSKDHHYPSDHKLTVYAVGLKIDGVNEFILAQNIKINVETTTGLPVESPTKLVRMDTNYTLVGGGAFLDARCTLCTGGANLLYRSAPFGQNIWYTAGKSHIYSGFSKLTAYAIGINKNFLNSLNIEVIDQKASTYVSSGSAYAGIHPNTGSVLIGVGAEATYNGSGRLLTHISPWGNHAFAKSKDHGYADSGSTTIYAWSLRKR